jgi:hypothetical protein
MKYLTEMAFHLILLTWYTGAPQIRVEKNARTPKNVLLTLSQVPSMKATLLVVTMMGQSAAGGAHLWMEMLSLVRVVRCGFSS